MSSLNARGRTVCVLAIPVLFLVTGCGHAYRSKIDSVIEPYLHGQYAVAGQNALNATSDDDKGHRDRLMWLLEQGAALRAAGRFDQSNKAFDDADKLFEKYDKAAKIRLGREAISAMASPAALTYEGYGYDRIMTNVYKAANYLESGRPLDARIEIRRIADSQERCEERYKDKIAQAEQAKRDSTKQTGYDIDTARAQRDPKLRSGTTALMSEFPDVQQEQPLDNLKHKALYTNPFAEYLQGLFYLYSDAGGDREIGRVAIRNAAGMAPGCRMLRGDLDDAEKIAGFTPVAPKTYVIFETGMAPKREEFRIDIPIFLISLAARKDMKVDYVGIAFPKLHPYNREIFRYLTVSSPRGSIQTELIVDVDKIVAREFKNEMPMIITRAIIGAATKAAMQYAVAEATKKQDAWAQVLARGAVAIYSAAMNEADLRTWRTLPKQVQIASCQTPADGRIGLRFGVQGAFPTTVNVKPGKSNIIWVRSPSPAAVPLIRTFPLN